MEMRGTRPVKDDPDSFLRISYGCYGWPDYTTNLQSVGDPKYQPDEAMMIRSGYPDLAPIVNPEKSGWGAPDANASVLVYGVFPSLSGAAKFDFAPEAGAFKAFGGNAIVALSGYRAPFATNGVPLLGPVGFKICRVDLDNPKQLPKDFIRNVVDVPASMQAYGTLALERPIDVKFGPDGALYILDFGRMENKTAIPRYFDGTGRLFRLVPVAENTTTKAAE
jgi:glucose/arabinose dehydrogenase